LGDEAIEANPKKKRRIFIYLAIMAVKCKADVLNLLSLYNIMIILIEYFLRQNSMKLRRGQELTEARREASKASDSHWIQKLFKATFELSRNSPICSERLVCALIKARAVSVCLSWGCCFKKMYSLYPNT
jgi:hypothetical protein